MQPGGALVETFGWLVGVGPGAGFGLLILLCGIGGALVGLSGYVVKDILNLDDQSPDYQRENPVAVTPPSQPALATSEVIQKPDKLFSADDPPGPAKDTSSNPGETQKSQP